MAPQVVKKFFDDSVPGDLPLARVFWIEGVLVSQVLFLCLLAVYQWAPAAALITGAVAFLAYTAWIMRRIWLNAPNASRPEWTWMSRVLTIGWTVNSVTVCVFLVLAKFGNQPLQILH